MGLRLADVPVSHSVRQRGGGMVGRPGGSDVHTHTHLHNCLREIKSTLVYNAQCLSKLLCALLWPQETDRHTVNCLIILLVSCLACHILDKATKSDGRSSTTSQSQFINSQTGEETLSGQKCRKYFCNPQVAERWTVIKFHCNVGKCFYNKSFLWRDKICVKKIFH